MDTTNPAGGHSVWFEAGKQATKDYGIFGEAWAWASGPCAVWSSFDADVYQGPYNAVTANPILVVGNFYDPATRYEGALAARSLLDGSSALLSVNEPGHTSLGLSVCAGFVTGLYLSNPQLYAPLVDGFQCASEGNWFEKVSTAASDGDLGASLRVRVIEHIAFRP